nr:nucleotide pyrophosphatase/phosphodiesterase family protein [Flexivirga aerilata]
MPRVAASLGALPLPEDWPAAVALPEARRAVVVLADGLGAELLRRRSGHAPFLRSVIGGQPDHIPATLSAGFPSTTATSMGTFGTGLPPGEHGLVGYQLRIPGTDRLFNELDWIDGPDPLQWQPHPTMFERVGAAGVPVTMVGPGKFDGSGLTRAALRGARFAGARDLPGAVDAALAAVRDGDRALVYLYWGAIDSTGHQYGCESWQWGDAVEAFDGEMRRLAASLPAGTSLTATADHGMVDLPDSAKIDVATDPELGAGVELAGGEMRAAHLYCRPGAADDVRAAWEARLGDDAWVMSREKAVAAGLFGTVSDAVLPRIGDVVVAMHGVVGAYDSRVMRPRVSSLIGQHGSLTDAEQLVPMIHLPAQ